MSSHYFVKEGQEPAIFILEPVAHSLVEPLLEWAPYVLVADIALEQVMSWGTRVDAVLSCGRFEAQLKELRLQQVFELFFCSRENEMIRSCIDILRTKKQTAVHITIRDDDAEAFSIGGSVLGVMDVSLLSNTHRWLPVRQTFEKWLPADYRYEIRKTTENQQITQRGFYVHDQFIIAESDGMASISSKDIVWLGELI